MMLHLTLSKENKIQEAGCRGLVTWILGCSTASYPVPWMNNSCKWCMGDIVRALTITTHSQIKKLVDQARQKQDGDLISLLKDCIIALASLQGNVDETECISQNRGVILFGATRS